MKFQMLNFCQFLNPAIALHGGASYLAFVCVSVTKISKKIEPINFIFGGGLPSDPGRKPFDFEKNLPGVRVGLGGRNLSLMIRHRRKYFEWL